MGAGHGLVELLVNARPLHKGDGALASSTGARGPFAGCRTDAEGAKAMSENQDETPEQRPRWHDQERPNVNLEWERQVEAIKPELKALSEDKRFTEGVEAIAEMDLSDWIQDLPTEERETILNTTLSDLDDHLRTIEGLSIDGRKVIIGKALSALDERLRGLPTRKFILEATLAGVVAFAAEGAPQFVGRFGMQNLRAWVFAEIEACVYKLLGDDAAAQKVWEDFYGWLSLQQPEADSPAVLIGPRKAMMVPGMSDHHIRQVRDLLNSWRAKQKPGPKLGSHHTKKREPGKFRQECKKVGEFWEKGLKNPETIFLLIMRESSRNPEQARKWVAKRYCALLNSVIRNRQARIEPDEDAIRTLRIEPHVDEKSQLRQWGTMR